MQRAPKCGEYCRAAEPLAVRVLGDRCMHRHVFIWMVLLAIAGTPAAAQESIDRFWDRNPTVQVGQLDGADPHVFGEIRAVVSLGDQGFVVLDRLSNELRWFSNDGTWITSVGGSGGGPGEFRTPMAAHRDAGGWVWVADWENGRLSAFVATGQDLVLREEIALLGGPLRSPEDLCDVRGQLLLNSKVGDDLFHMVSEGVETRSFGAPLPVEVPAALEALRQPLTRRGNEGRIACTPNGVVVFLHDELPFLRSFALDTGEELWRTELSNYNRLRFVAGPNGGAQYAADPESGTTHYGRSLVLEDETAYVSLSETGWSGEPSYELRLFSLEDGEEISTANVPFWLAALGRDWAYVVAEDPYPRVLVFQRHRPAP